MKISYNWLQDYISTDLAIEQLSEILTDIGLEVEGIEKFESVKGGLEGIVIGEVKSAIQHPNADRLKCTKVDVGQEELLDIVCGAPNVAVGQKVLVALVGATLYTDDTSFQIKKSKIRGEVSEGMICAEDELGLGKSHEGIMVLETTAKVGQPAAEYFKLESDYIIEIGLTPNRADATSHYGVARDLAVYFNLKGNYPLNKPAVENFKQDNSDLAIQVSIEDSKACPRYSGLCLTNVKVAASPSWMQNRLKAIGLKPINNIVDITNYVLHEIGQPLHAFDASKIKGNKVLVKQLPAETKFKTLDGFERELASTDLMICNEAEGMCIAGVFGGEQSGVNESTTSIFLESAYFNPVSVRQTAKRHGLNTDASFRYERGADPEITVYALKRAAMLMQEIAGAKVSSAIFDFYPEKVQAFKFDFHFANCDRLIGEAINRNLIQQILKGLDIEITKETNESLSLSVPSYRVDVQREVDVIEEILRIYGYNKIKMPDFMRSNLSPAIKPDAVKIENTISDYLSSNGFAEIFNNSLTNPKYYPEQKDLVNMVNPLSSELEVLRKSMLFGGLESIAHNQNRKRKNLKFYEFGTTYIALGNSKFEETKRLAIWITGDQFKESWQQNTSPVNFFGLKEMVENCLQRIGQTKYKTNPSSEDSYFSQAIQFQKGKHELVHLGQLSSAVLKQMDIKEAVYYAEFNWTLVLSTLNNSAIQYKPVVKFPAVRRDLALLIDEQVEFDAIKALAKNGLKQALKEVNLFDVYEGKNLAAGKKSYGVSFILQDENKTLTDKQVDSMMERLIATLQKELGAELR